MMTHTLLEDEFAEKLGEGNSNPKNKSDGCVSAIGSYIYSREGEMLPAELPTDMTDNNDSLVVALKFEVVSARTVDSPKKYVAYTIKVSKDGSVANDRPCIIERRYSEFLELYTNLRQEFPAIFSSVTFPKKAILGNFSPEMISFRKAGFESLLELLAQHEKVRESPSVIDFMQKKERDEAIIMIQDKNHYSAIVLLENNFFLLNKLLTNRHPLVLRALCLLVACCDAVGDSKTQQFAQTAVHRFEAVSDTDLLRYYVPLLQLCVRLLQNTVELQDIDMLQERLSCMKRRGMKVDGCPSLLDAVLSDYLATESCMS